MTPPTPSTHDKALAINLHPAQYGTFAEIDAFSHPSGEDCFSGFWLTAER